MNKLPSHRPPDRATRPGRSPALPSHGTALAAAVRLALLAGLAVPVGAQADGAALPAGLAPQLQALVGDAARTLWGTAATPPRVEVTVGQLDPRLKLAPCTQIEPYVPAGSRPLGQTRVGLRCRQGPTHWNVYLPVTVRLWAQALVARTALPPATVLEASHLMLAEVDLATSTDPALALPERALGRTLARGLGAGDTLRQGDLKARQWFNPGDVVRITANGPGYAIQTEGVAVGPGIEGLPGRVRIENGRVLTGMPVAERAMELNL